MWTSSYGWPPFELELFSGCTIMWCTLCNMCPQGLMFSTALCIAGELLSCGAVADTLLCCCRVQQSSARCIWCSAAVLPTSTSVLSLLLQGTAAPAAPGGA